MEEFQIAVEPSSITAPKEADSYPVTVTSNTSWTATVDNDALWCTLTDPLGTNDGTFTIHVTALPDDINEHIATITVSGNGLSESITVFQSDNFVEINGLLWAKCNVSEPGTFTASPDTRGMLYQWTSKVPWSCSSPSTSSSPPDFPGRQFNDGPEWLQENNPCPAGWRVPTIEEINALVGTPENPKYAWHESDAGFDIPGAIVGIPQSEGLLATKDDMRGGIFLPQMGWRWGANEDDWTPPIAAGEQTNCWEATITSSTSLYGGWYRHCMIISMAYNGSEWAAQAITASYRSRSAWPIRCVRDK